MNHAALGLAIALLNHRVWRYKLRQMMMADAQGRGGEIRHEDHIEHTVERIDQLIAEEILEWR